MDKVRIVALGGLDEMYKTCVVIEINDDIFVVDCGMKFPDITKPGIDYVIARTDYLVENKDRVKGYFISYGHDSCFGGIPHIVKNVPAPVYCTDIAKAFLGMFCKHNHLDYSHIDFHIVEPTDKIVIAGHEIEFFSTCSNVAKSMGVCFHTDQGNVIYLSNNVFDNNNDKDFNFDVSKAAEISAKNRTLVLLQDSLYADNVGYTNPRYRTLPAIQRTLRDAPGRVLVAIDSPDIYNIIAVINEAMRLGRKIVVYDNSTKDVIDVLIKTKCLNLDEKAFLPMDEVNRYRAQNVLILLVAFPKSLFYKLSLLAAHLNDEQILKLQATDTVIIASYAGSEVEIAKTNALNELYKNDCKIFSLDAKTSLKMHSSVEDIKMALSIFKPRYYIPIMGALTKLFANAKIAVGMNIGLNHNNVFVLDNGIQLEFDNFLAKVLPNRIITGNIYVDGKGVGDIEKNVLLERQKFSDDGVLILAATISKSKRDIVLGPDIQSRGLVFVKESDSLMKEITKIFLLNIRQELAKENYSISYMEMTIKEQVFKAIRRSILKSPTIIPIIEEID